MTRPRRRPRVTVEDLAVPSWNLVDEFMEALGHAASDIGPHRPDGLLPPPPPPRDWRARHPRPQAEPLPLRGPIYIYPWINRDVPWGCANCSPMGEGSEDTAVPPVDPAEARLHPEHIDVAPPESETAHVVKLQTELRYRWA
jgi:hypothetical protein